MSDKPIITRIAPSPTGYLHIGTARAALFNYLFARQHGGKFILRIDDTDRERSTEEFATNIVEGLEWLGISYDETYRQSDRSALYREQLNKLIDENKAYISKEVVVNEGDRDEVIRFRNPGTVISFDDLIRGTITFDTTELGDFVIAKDLETPLYHFASVVDDLDLGISHVIRGEDHISNTPRQILMLEALGGQRPAYAHVPLILAPDRSKLSKRHGAVAVTEYAKEGYLPAAFINFMALLGWSPQAATDRNPGTNEEVFTLTQLEALFSLSAVSSSGAIFNIEKLQWLNKEHLKRQPQTEVYEGIKNYLPVSRLTDRQITLLCSILIEKINTFHDVAHIWNSGEFDFLLSEPTVSAELLKTPNHLPGLIELLSSISDDNFVADNIKTTIWDFATEKGRGEVLWPMRTALTGREKSLDPFTAAELLGKTATLNRLKKVSI